ncbi:protein MAINTENANCE OF MERISTEMS-like [Papaver somniferum]|uniref:protein MAINTENANCE OF MERISTEMS-like n=1 Tax=Papaver somniferum TaxID=3469 RepID=UPI000E6F9169|nr:protein MAINTENANCE OF MERISTEMS-like [Papaver somniferum]
MAITPDDAQQILGLEVDGKAVTEGFNNKFSFNDIYALSQKLFGLNHIERESVLEMKDGRLSKKFNLKKLRDTLWETKKRIRKECSGSLVEASYLQLLDPLDKMREYSWGTAVVAFLKNELTKCSRELTKQVNENTCLFQVWIYLHFPSLFKGNSYVIVGENIAINKPRAQRYSFKGGQDKEMPQQLMKLRNAIDKLTADDVIFDPYRDDRR